MDHRTHGGRQVTSLDIAKANDYFEHFLNATSLKNILGYYRSICDHLNLKPNLFPLFYPKLKAYLTSWRAKALWKKFDARALHKCYGKGKLCSNSRVLIIGGGPCGLRTAIEAQLLGAKVVVIEKRDRLSRHNVLHLWPFVIEDLRALGAKKFFGKFCAGSIDHISIRQLQCILLKIVLLLGVEVHTEVSFERLIEPDASAKTGWRAEYDPPTHPVSQYEFDVIIGADGKRNTLQGFKRKEFRGKLAIAITANFINKRTEAEARVEEISGVAFIFNQKFFKDLYEATGIDLENIVYYKDETHYFVMTAKKASLIEKGVIRQDLADTEKLLAMENVDREALMNYAIEAANFSTNYQMPDLEFALNHYGHPDVAMFDFTSMYAAENASKVLERGGYKLLTILVGDSLLEPFWPTGSGCARGFLSSFDAAWAIRSWNSGTTTPLDVLAERESIYRLLAQTTPDNLNKEWKSYTLDPTTRYPNLNKNVVTPIQTLALFDTDDPKAAERMRRNTLDLVQAPPSTTEISKKRRRDNVDSQVLLRWIAEQVRAHTEILVEEFGSVFRDGRVLCAILNHYRPDLLDYGAVKDEGPPEKLNQLAIDILDREIGISPVMTGEELTTTSDYLTMATYLTQVYDAFRCEIPHIKHPKLISPQVAKPSPKCLPYLPPPCEAPIPQTPERKSSLIRQTFETIFEEVTPKSSGILRGAGDFRIDRVKKNVRLCPPKNVNGRDVEINFIELDAHKRINYSPATNTLQVRFLGGHRKTKKQRHRPNVRSSPKNVTKFPWSRGIVNAMRRTANLPEPLPQDQQVFARVSDWISTHDFRPPNGVGSDPDGVETNLVDGVSDITSVTRNMERAKEVTSATTHDGLVVEERTDVVKCGSEEELSDGDELVKRLTKFSQYAPFDKKRRGHERTASPSHFSVIAEGEEIELPDTKKSDSSFKSFKNVQSSQNHAPLQPAHQPPRPSSRHKRHAAESIASSIGLITSVSNNKRESLERKNRKRRTLEKIGASVIFRKFLNSFLESTLVGFVLVVLDLLVNSNHIQTSESSFRYF